jgi:hypothetical protein
MTDHEQPQHGGSYIRDKDGKLTRVEDGAVTAPAEMPAPADAKPARTKKEK